jgi:hypothetical protein
LLLRKTAEAEARTLTLVGLAVVLCAAVTVLFAFANPFGGRPKNLISIEIDTPYVGQGVAPGTAVIMHGVEIGEVTAVSSLPGGGVKLDADLQSRPAAGLTTSLGIDFRPKNYFGVTGINVDRGQGGRPLQDGMRIDTVPRGNFTLQTLLSRLGEITDGVVTPQLVEVIDKSTRYIDALDPLIETLLIVAKAVDSVQTISTEQLLRNTTGLSVAFPSFVNAVSDAGDQVQQFGLVVFDDYGSSPLLDYPGGGRAVTEQFWRDRFIPTIHLVAFGLYGALGHLESSHMDDLLPAVQMTNILADTVPGLIRPANIADTLVELRTRFEKMYGGSPEQRALQVHIVLDRLPGLAAPLGAMGVTP